MKTNIQDILLKIKNCLQEKKNHRMCVEQQFTQAKCVTSASSKIENKTRVLGSDLGPRIGLRYRARKNNSFSCNLASCRIILKIHLFSFSKLAEKFRHL